MQPEADDARAPRPRAVVVMGVSGAGKSTVGGLLARTVGCPFLEGDAHHGAANVAKMASGTPLSDEDRWPWLDALGAAAKAALASSPRVVVACSALKRGYRERLTAAIGAPTLFVLLDAQREALECRMATRSGHFMPASLLDSQLATLERPAPDEMALTLDADEPPETLCRRIVSVIDGAGAPPSQGRTE